LPLALSFLNPEFQSLLVIREDRGQKCVEQEVNAKHQVDEKEKNIESACMISRQHDVWEVRSCE
jgi:hypothetical protein